MRVGVPRALLYYRYGRFWERFLKELGTEVVVSRRTDKELVKHGLGLVSSEVCLPIKVVAGHLAELAGSVDAVFFPRMVWLKDQLYACPKMIGIADIARHIVGDRSRLVTPSIKRRFALAHLAAGIALTGNPFRAVLAYRRARCELGRPGGLPGFDPAQRKVALIGHFYNIQDEYVGGAIERTFRERGYRLYTKEELPERILASRAGFAGKIRWYYERELYNAFRFLVGRVDGVCVIVSMGCGPDSLIAEFMREEAGKLDVPFLQLVIDEHTGVAGLVTRIEAFLEMIERRRSVRRDAAMGQGR